MLALLGALASGCTDDPAPVPSGCPAENQIGGVCAGVPAAALCSGDPCTSGVACSNAVQASSDAELAAAIAGATSGTCIALSPGSYTAADLPGGVSLLGRSPELVQVGKVTLAAGSGATVRGLRVGGGGVSLAGATGARIEAVRVVGSAAEGIAVGASSSVEIVDSAVEGAARYGVRIDDGATVTMERTLVAGCSGPGIWSACSEGCACAARPSVSIAASIVRDNRLAGVAFFATDASLQSVDVLRTRVGDTWHFGEGGGALSIAQCSSVGAKATRLLDNKSFGALVDDSSAELGGPDTLDGVEVRNNLFGVYLQHVSKTQPSSVTVENASLTDNSGVGLGIGGASVGIIIICKTAITGTQLASLPVLDDGMGAGGVKEVGDGFDWLEGSEVTVQDLALSGNARASLLIDGPVSGSLTNVTLGGGDEQLGIVQQNYEGGAQPQTGASVPMVQTTAENKFVLAKPPSVLDSL